MIDTTDANPHFDLCGQIMAYEAGEFDQEEELDLFEHLVKIGLIYQLQGSYGRRAHALGLI
jgi:hypothetical protein